MCVFGLEYVENGADLAIDICRCIGIGAVIGRPVDWVCVIVAHGQVGRRHMHTVDEAESSRVGHDSDPGPNGNSGSRRYSSPSSPRTMMMPWETPTCSY